MSDFMTLDDIFEEREQELRDAYKRDLESGKIAAENAARSERMAKIDWDAVEDEDDNEEYDDCEDDDEDEEDVF